MRTVVKFRHENFYNNSDVCFSVPLLGDSCEVCGCEIRE